MMPSWMKDGPCVFCGMYHPATCPRIERIEYFPDGEIKSVTLFREQPPTEETLPKRVEK